MSRHYTITTRTGPHAPSSARFGEPEAALGHFENMLYASEHSDAAVRRHLLTLTAVLMKGGTSYTVMDPDLNGSVEISITTR